MHSRHGRHSSSAATVQVSVFGRDPHWLWKYAQHCDATSGFPFAMLSAFFDDPVCTSLGR
jgi:hypothetical protein